MWKAISEPPNNFVLVSLILWNKILGPLLYNWQINPVILVVLTKCLGRHRAHGRSSPSSRLEKLVLLRWNAKHYIRHMVWRVCTLGTVSCLHTSYVDLLAGGQSDEEACDNSRKCHMTSLPSSSPHLPYLCADLNTKAVTRINSMPNVSSRARRGTESHTEPSVIQNQSLSTSPAPLEVGSMVEVVSNTKITVYGVVKWLGVPAGKTGEWAGIELVRHSNVLLSSTVGVMHLRHLFRFFFLFQDYEVNGCSDGQYGGKRYFTCKESRALFVPVTKCSPDGRFVYSSARSGTSKPTEIPPG